MKIKALGFDIDGTLYHNWQMYRCSLPSFFRSPSLVSAFGKVRKEIRTLQWDGDFRETQARFLAKHLEVSEGEAKLRMERDLYGVWETSYRHLKPCADVKTVLSELKKRGYKLGALSDFPVQNKLIYLGLDDLFDVALSAETVGRLKPDPAPFRALADTLGVAPEEVLYVGNSYKYDVIGSKSAGMAAAHFTRKEEIQGTADFSFHKYSDFLSLMENLISK